MFRRESLEEVRLNEWFALQSGMAYLSYTDYSL